MENGLLVYPGGEFRRHTIEEARSLASVHITQGISWYAAAFLLINAALGAGILHYPFCYAEAGGIVVATAVQIVMLLLLSSTMIVLASAADLEGDNTYHDVLRTTCGVMAQKAAALSVLLACYGVSVTFMVIIGDQYDRLFLSLHGSRFCDSFHLRREFTIMATSVLCILPLCFFKKLDFLKYASTLGVFVMFYPVLLTALAFSGVSTLVDRETSLTDLLDSAIKVIPTVCFAYQTHEVVIPIYANLGRRSLGNMSLATALCMLTLFAVYSTTGVLGYLTFGAAVRPDIMQNFDANSPWVLLGMAALIVKMIATYPLLVVCGGKILEDMSPWASTDSRRIFLNICWFFSTLVAATTISNLADIIEYIGALACANIFVFPGCCLLGASLQRERFKVKRPIPVFLFGLVLVLIGLALALLVTLHKVFSEDHSVETLLCIPRS
ncbi:putative sodium-coupled neutral amino acid transporter 7 [Galendromus occidentalis]|uniref:Sodium-coupled neutral amino acid transporter 7 n=1 Tax=Galendromus occidentalis TaxID=34638 RepID=A0AAJ7WH76_9ACAR|nr:putative sodium-coupled neutral amino acid transporter 7 [Galendromus occidentalis]